MKVMNSQYNVRRIKNDDSLSVESNIVGDTTNVTIFEGTTDKTVENDSSNDGEGTSIVMTSNKKQIKFSYVVGKG